MHQRSRDSAVVARYHGPCQDTFKLNNIPVFMHTMDQAEPAIKLLESARGLAIVI